MITVVIPTYNEQDNVVHLIRYLKEYGGEQISDIIVVDAGSTDNTVIEAFSKGAKVVVSPVKSRAAQMNFGAAEATGEILYFVHADVLPPKNFVQEILLSVKQGYNAGNFSSVFQSSKKIMKVNSMLSHSKSLFIRGGGDLTLFITKQAFEEVGGFDEKYIIMEDFDMVKRIRQKMNFAPLSSKAVVSARKYKHNAYWKVSMTYVFTYLFYRLGASPTFLLKFYKCLIRDENKLPCKSKEKPSPVYVGDLCHHINKKAI